MPTREQMIAEMQAARTPAPTAGPTREQMLAEMQAAGYKPEPVESGLEKAADVMNTVGGTSRAGWQDMLESALGMSPSPATPVDPQARLDLALKGKYPNTRDIYQLDKRLPNPMDHLPDWFPKSGTFGSTGAKTGDSAVPLPDEKPAHPLAAMAGFAGDVATDATGAAIGLPLKVLGMLGEEAAPMLRNAARLSPEEAQAFNTSTQSGLKDKARAAANAIADLIDRNPNRVQTTSPISTGVQKLGKKIYASGLAPLDAAAAGNGPKPSDLFWDNGTLVTGKNAAGKTRDYIDQALNENMETFTKAGARTSSTLSKLDQALANTEKGGPPAIGPLTEDQAHLKYLLAKRQEELLAQPDGVTKYLRERLKRLEGSPEGASARNFGEQRLAEENLWGPQDVANTVDEAKRLRVGARPVYGSNTPPEVAKMKNDLVHGRNDELSRILENIPDAGEDVKNAVRTRNKNVASMIDAEDAAPGMAGGPSITASDIGVPAGLWAFGLKGAALPFLAIKKGAQAVTSTGGRSAIGLALKAAGAAGDATLNQAFVHGQSPWSLLPPESK